ncbi:MAG: HIT domain-containing protein, partial [Maritimibacter sp.]
MAYAYDDQNIFAKILRGEIPNNTVLETDYCLAFHDIGPQAPIHVLVIPKGPYVNWDHFVAEASPEEVVGYSKGIHAVVAELGLEPGEGGNGYRLIMNAGEHGMQEVPHLHV